MPVNGSAHVGRLWRDEESKVFIHSSRKTAFQLGCIQFRLDAHNQKIIIIFSEIYHIHSSRPHSHSRIQHILQICKIQFPENRPESQTKLCRANLFQNGLLSLWIRGLKISRIEFLFGHCANLSHPKRQLVDNR